LRICRPRRYSAASGLLAGLVAAALCYSSVAVASSTRHQHKRHQAAHARHHRRRHRPAPPKPKPTLPTGATVLTPTPPQTIPTPVATTPTSGTPTPTPTPTPKPPTVKADLAIVSNTASDTQAKVGDSVTFTIVAKNYGPDPAKLWVNVADSSTGLGGEPSNVTCGDGVSSDGPLCESGVVQPGGTLTDVVVMTVMPTSRGSASDIACAVSFESNDQNPSNDCKTSLVRIDRATCPVSVPGATQTLGNVTYNLEGEDTFTRDAPLGSFASTDWTKTVYTGDHGMGWAEYPDGWASTNSGTAEGYQPSTVQWVHDGILDFYLHRDSAGDPVGASISPSPAGNRYQVYGAWSFCERVPPYGGHALNPLFGYHQAPLLWPEDTPANPSNGQWAESDFPEGDLYATSTTDAANQFSAYAHYGGSRAQDQFQIQSVLPLFDPTQWHVYTQTWGPGFRSYYVDGQFVGTSTNQVWSQPERWQLQIEPSLPVPDSGLVAGAGHVYVKWVWIGTPSS
jgi:hypothetical protein